MPTATGLIEMDGDFDVPAIIQKHLPSAFHKHKKILGGIEQAAATQVGMGVPRRVSHVHATAPAIRPQPPESRLGPQPTRRPGKRFHTDVRHRDVEMGEVGKCVRIGEVETVVGFPNDHRLRVDCQARQDVARHKHHRVEDL